MSDKRKDKRWKREHGKRTKREIPKVVARANALVGIPFVKLPGITDHKSIIFTSKNGTGVSAEDVEMVFNDCLLMDAISNWGEDGPLVKDTYESDLEREVYEFALKAYEGVEIPEKLRRPT